MNKFFTSSQSNKCLIVEALFWKSKALVRELAGEGKPLPRTKSKPVPLENDIENTHNEPVSEEEAEYVSNIKLAVAVDEGERSAGDASSSDVDEDSSENPLRISGMAKALNEIRIKRKRNVL